MTAQHATETPAFLKKHYTVEFFAEQWGYHPDTVRQWFRNEPGVLAKRGSGGKYVSLRIPTEVAERVYQREVIKAR